MKCQSIALSVKHDSNPLYMPDVLLVAATHAETAFITGKVKKNSRETLFPVMRGGDSTTDLLITGPGIHATSFHLGKQSNLKDYKICINIGICGSLDREIRPVRLVNVTTDLFGDFGVDNKGEFLDVFEAGLYKLNEFPFRNGRLSPKPVKRLLSLKALTEVNGITVQTVTGSKKTVRELSKRYGPSIESMEGAAFFYACMQSEVNCLQVRSVSNMVEDRDKSKWKIREAIDSLEGITGLILSELRAGKKK